MAAFTRTPSNLLGSPGSPSPIAATAASTVTLTIGSGNSNLEGQITVEVNISATPPSTNPTIQFDYTYDGSKFFLDDRYGVPVVPITTPNATYDYSYVPPLGAVAAQVTITNGETNGITALIQGDTTAVT
jgi:hypothetical protein